MPISAPTIRGGKTAQQIAALQADQQQRGLMTPEAATLNAAITQTPAYQAYQAILQRPATAYDQQQAKAALTATLAPLGASIPDSVIFDPDTGQFRQKNWNEAHSNLSALAYIGATTGAGLAGGAALGALAGAGGVGVGETGAVTGLTGSGFGTGAGLGYTAIAPTVGEALGAGAAGGIGTLSGTAPVLEGVAAGPGAITAPTVGEALGAGGLTTGGPAGYVGGDVLATEAASTAPGLTALSTGAPAAFAGLPAGSVASGAVPAAFAGSAGPSVASTILNSALGGSVASPYGWIGPAIQGVTGIINTNKAVGAQEDATAEQAAATKYARPTSKRKPRPTISRFSGSKPRTTRRRPKPTAPPTMTSRRRNRRCSAASGRRSASRRGAFPRMCRCRPTPPPRVPRLGGRGRRPRPALPRARRVWRSGGRRVVEPRRPERLGRGALCGRGADLAGDSRQKGRNRSGGRAGLARQRGGRHEQDLPARRRLDARARWRRRGRAGRRHGDRLDVRAAGRRGDGGGADRAPLSAGRSAREYSTVLRRPRERGRHAQDSDGHARHRRVAFFKGAR